MKSSNAITFQVKLIRIILFSLFLSGPLFPNVDDSLNAYNDLIKMEFSRRWSKHKCDVPGCSTVLIFDGGCKATRKICGAVKSEVRSLHHDHKSPVLTPNQISKESLASLNGQQSSREKFLMTGLERDNIFVVEGELRHILKILPM